MFMFNLFIFSLFAHIFQHVMPSVSKWFTEWRTNHLDLLFQNKLITIRRGWLSVAIVLKSKDDKNHTNLPKRCIYIYVFVFRPIKASANTSWPIKQTDKRYTLYCKKKKKSHMYAWNITSNVVVSSQTKL